MKLLVVCPDWFPFSAGLAQSCYEFCIEAQKAGHEVRIIAAKDKDLDNKGLDVRPVTYLFRVAGKSPFILNYWKKIGSHIAWSDKIILYSYMFEMNSRVVLFRRLGLFNKPIIHMYRGSLENDVLKNVSFPIKFMKWSWDATFGRVMFTGVGKTISNSKPTCALIQKKYTVPKKRITYVPSAIRLEDYKPSQQKNKQLIFIGRLVENKGILLFEKIISTLPKDWKVVIVGNGPLSSKVSALAKKYPQVSYKGKLSAQKTREQLTKSSLLFLPSFAEGSPRVVLEALASGVVPVSFDVGDVATVLESNKAGFRVPLGDVDQFIKQLHLLCTDEKLRLSMAKRALLAAKKYDWNTIFPQLEKEINNV
jgi:glycosyltransferase involved in cell wall biosynthesis